MLLPFFEWCETLWLGQFVIGSNWLFPVIESVHLLGLALLGGSVLLVDLRLLGLGLKDRAVSELALDARHWMLTGLAIMIVTGIPLFLSEPIKLYYSTAFWIKITTLPIALAFAFTVRARVALADPVSGTARRQQLVGALSIALWVTVAVAGRWIGFS